ncbi:hypothetical protein Efla_006381 [Eimeria flavescens]
MSLSLCRCLSPSLCLSLSVRPPHLDLSHKGEETRHRLDRQRALRGPSASLPERAPPPLPRFCIFPKPLLFWLYKYIFALQILHELFAFSSIGRGGYKQKDASSLGAPPCQWAAASQHIAAAAVQRLGGAPLAGASWGPSSTQLICFSHAAAAAATAAAAHARCSRTTLGGVSRCGGPISSKGDSTGSSSSRSGPPVSYGLMNRRPRPFFVVSSTTTPSSRFYSSSSSSSSSSGGGSHYATLGVAANATQAEIRQARKDADRRRQRGGDRLGRQRKRR